MPRVWRTSHIELKVMGIVKKYLEDDLKKYEGILDGGIYFKYKPASIRLKVIELNCTDYLQSESLSTISDCYLNVNYQDEDEDLVKEVTDHIHTLIDQSLLRNLYFESEGKQVGRISPYLWMGNNMFKITNNTIYKKKKQNDRVE
ncbi:hypothetical protein MUK51_11145 [Sphingobacterium faecium]|uniref:hypothetical protein n=1 Tax=Sphingobacterium faecium TaxID=34087 RepID=UPI0021B4EB71|nr:hypothetical protein [Sphingobacterium faecium]UXD67784.1 hypothetical protein MUK51_11145 [Sphingobacterium faecium]